MDVGWLVVAVGVGMDVVGWYQISGQPTEAQQLPYLASATIPGAALIVAGAVLVAARRRAEESGSRRGVRAAGGVGVVGAGRRDGLWAVPDGSYLHRGDCPLLDGKAEAFEVTGEAGGSGSVPARACPICEPDLVTAA
ncbi:MAG TPA: hypothetical protein VFU65_13030 [Actinocrinis sp.]|nr:hypothetical protein [Actinocrinis sp.]